VGVAQLIVVAYTAAVAVSALLLFRRATPRRPWIGVIDLPDLVVVFVAIVAFPELYLALPTWAGTVLLAVAAWFAIYFVLRMARGSSVVAGAVSTTAVAAEGCIALLSDGGSDVLLLVNGAVLAVPVLALAIRVVQFGVRARDIALLAAALALFELFADSQLALMPDLIERASGDPYLPAFGWTDGTEVSAIGLGELLIAATFPLAARKAFGRAAGLSGVAASVVAIAIVLGPLEGDVPPMVCLGSAVVAHYCWWLRRRSRERATWEYLRDEPFARPMPA
jgi:hypothetical protein